MRRGSTQSIVFTPPAANIGERHEADKQAEVFVDPQEAVLVYGHMLTDVEIIAAELRSLLFAGSDYRSKLRVIRSAAKRLEDRAARLLGE